MTNADIKRLIAMLTATTRYLQECVTLLRESASELNKASDYLSQLTTHIDRTITTGMKALDDDDEP